MEEDRETQALKGDQAKRYIVRMLGDINDGGLKVVSREEDD